MFEVIKVSADRSTDCTAGPAGKTEQSGECLEDEGSLQNPQKIKRAIQVLAPLIQEHAGA